MRIGVISDIHANLVALDAVFDDMPAVERVVHAGDVVGYNPWPAACVAALRERSIPSVVGNHDRAAVGATTFRFNPAATAGIEHAREELGPDGREWLAGLPTELAVADGRVRVVHGHPDDPDRYTYPEEFEPGMLGSADVLVTGHTHVQGARTFDEGVVVNPGSVGQPRDGDPRAAYAVVDIDAEPPAVEERRVPYEIDRVVARIRDVGLPERSAERLYVGQ